MGKTWLIREFAKSFPSFCEINLEAQPELIPLFKDYFGKPRELIRYLSAATGKTIQPGSTLLFIDEIQESPQALLSLRYFFENLPELHVVSAGSLVEFVLKELSFPVGRIEFMHLFPLSFEEYLWAVEKKELAEEIKQSSENRSLPHALHDAAMKEVRSYLLIGGMPAVVEAYTQKKDFAHCQGIQQLLIANYRADFSKYASRADVPHLRLLFDAIPRTIGQKLKYSHISKEIRSRELSKALGLMEQAGLVYKSVHSSGNGVPLNAESKPEKFKAFLLDIGLAQRILGLNLHELFISTTSPLHRGRIAEQFVAQELVALTPTNDSPRLFYWHREATSSQAEVDFLLESSGKVKPIEVKSGATGSMKSLHLFIKEKGLSEGYKISEAPFSKIVQNGVTLTNIPFYCIGSSLR
ncbi:MAG: ATP-binding protein [Deltaproteobacteria bacterium]|nr:ATP-binding protein [Deltaproteobacteria bacterium]MBI3293245.1 ATP-binding protein [Deltaproteobacteria bacterium]